MNAGSKTFWPLVAAVGLGVSFVGYCVYFDRKRRSAPDFAEKLRSRKASSPFTESLRQPSLDLERRRQQQPAHSHDDIDTSDPEEMRRYFLEKIQLGEDCLSRGDLDDGVDHLATAVAVCSQPQSLLGLFQQTLPPEVFQELIIRLPRIAQSIHGSSNPFGNGGGGGAIITEPDLE